MPVMKIKIVMICVSRHETLAQVHPLKATWHGKLLTVKVNLNENTNICQSSGEGQINCSQLY